MFTIRYIFFCQLASQLCTLEEYLIVVVVGQCPPVRPSVPPLAPFVQFDVVFFVPV